MRRKNVGDVFPDGKGYVDETGGGRESGTSGIPVASESGQQGPPEAAANPAARIADHDHPLCPSCHAERRYDGERIRELELALDAANTIRRGAEARVKELEERDARMARGIPELREKDGPDPDEKECLG